MKREGVVVIVNSVIWGAVLIGCAIALKGTGAYEKIQLILGGGAAFSLLAVGAAFRAKPKDQLK